MENCSLKNEKNIDRDLLFLDEEEQDLIESLNSAIDKGEFTPLNLIEQKKRQYFWMKIVENIEKCKTISPVCAL